MRDIPIQRDSVGAMSIASGSSIPNRSLGYVYRGTGFDQFLETSYPGSSTAKPKPKPKPKSKPKRKPKAKRLDINDVETWHLFPRRPTMRQLKILEAQARQKRQEQERVRRENAAKALRPSPGWSPMKGADLDALLEGI